MNAYQRLRKHHRPRSSNRPLILAIEIIVGGWIGIGLGFAILEWIK
jgi:hypothetical protein